MGNGTFHACRDFRRSRPGEVGPGRRGVGEGLSRSRLEEGAAQGVGVPIQKVELGEFLGVDAPVPTAPSTENRGYSVLSARIALLLNRLGSGELDQISPGVVRQPDGELKIAFVRANRCSCSSREKSLNCRKCRSGGFKR